MDYNYNIFDFIGNTGVFLLIASYFALTTDRISSKGLTYPLMNLLAAVFLTISLLDKPNLSSLIIEFFWSIISIYGIYQHFQSKNT